MILPLCISAVKINATPVSIDEILNDYHRKVFAGQSVTDATAYSRRTDPTAQTLEQETVAILVSAGYEAYNVTSENYYELEKELKTSFDELGFSPDGSYILVIAGEEATSTINPNSRLGNLPVQDMIDPGSGGAFGYVYNGKQYSMRYLITAGGTSERSKDIDVNTSYEPDFYTWLCDTFVTGFFDLCKECVGNVVSELCESCFFEPLLSWIPIEFGEENEYTLENGILTFSANGTWTYKYIEIWDEQFECWTKKARAEYAYVETSFTGTIGMGYSDDVIEINESDYRKYYSLYYNDTEPLKELAAQCFSGGSMYVDRTGHIDMFLYDRGDDEYDLIFTLYEPV